MTGSLALWSVEGNRQRLDGGSMYGTAPRALWERWSPPDAGGRIELACRALLVREASGRTLLFETGIGAFFPPRLRERYGVSEGGHRLVQNLAALGVRPADVDVVVLSHLHFDHAGGGLSEWREGEPYALVFDRARWVVSDAAWARALAPHDRDRASFVPELPPLLEATGRLEVVAGEASETLGSTYRLHRSEGHTPGLLLTEIPTDDGPLVFASDLAPGRPWVHLPITMGFDRWAERLVDEKRALFADLVGRGGWLCFTHDPDCAAARVVRDDAGRYGTRDEVAVLATGDSAG